MIICLNFFDYQGLLSVITQIVEHENWTLLDKITLTNVLNTKLQTFQYKSYILKVSFFNETCLHQSCTFCLEDIVHLFSHIAS
jgi:hypothetical protein